MASKINAPVSGVLQVNGVDVVTYTSAGASVAGNFTVSGESTINGTLTPHWNDIINGSFKVAQAGTSFPAAASGAYDLDGWFNTNTSAAVFTVSQDAGRSAGRLRRTVTVTTQDVAIAAGDLVSQDTRIEGANCIKYLAGVSVIGVWARSGVTGIHCVSVYNGTSSYVTEVNITVANTSQFFSIALPIAPVIAASTNTYGLEVRFCNLAGSTYQTSANAWNAGNLYATANQVNDMVTSNVFALEDVTMNLGTSVSVSEIPYEQELARCKRYYEFIDFPVSIILPGVVFSNSAPSISFVKFEVGKRITPTCTFSGAGRIVFPSNIGGTTGALSTPAVNTIGCAVQTTTTIAAASAGWIDSFSIYVSARL